MYRVDLNADLGEGGPHDAALLDFVTSANIACGGHAGDPDLMARTVELARQKGAAIGAHPGFPDREGFGRRMIQISPQEVNELVVSQVGSLLDLTRAADVPMQHVKPHGALYNAASVDDAVAAAIATAVAAIDPDLILFGLAGSELLTAGKAAGLGIAAEGFADRSYASDGTLTPRSEPGALINDPAIAAAQVIRFLTEGKVRSLRGDDIEVRVDTICIHGDTRHALSMARRIREQLEAARIEIRAPGQG